MPEIKPTLTVNAGVIGAEQRAKSVQTLLAEIVKLPTMRKARAEWDSAQERFEFIRRRPNTLSDAMKANSEALTAERQRFSDAVCSRGPIPDDASTIARLSALDKELAHCLETLMLDRIPRAEVASLVAQAEYLECFAGELSKAAAERMKATLGALVPALLAEGNLSFDPTQTVSGQLQKRATAMLEEAEGLRRQAAEVCRRFKLEGEN
jgi:hypothetical protein